VRDDVRRSEINSEMLVLQSTGVSGTGGTLKVASSIRDRQNGSLNSEKKTDEEGNPGESDGRGEGSLRCLEGLLKILRRLEKRRPQQEC